MALRRLRLLVRACFSRWRHSPTSSELAQKRSKRGNIATALASERANFPDGDDGHLGLTAAYVATSGLTSQGPLPPPCSAGRSSRDPVSSPAFRSTWALGPVAQRHRLFLRCVSEQLDRRRGSVGFACCCYSAACRSLWIVRPARMLNVAMVFSTKCRMRLNLRSMDRGISMITSKVEAYVARRYCR
jgi:hypothetical protein